MAASSLLAPLQQMPEDPQVSPLGPGPCRPHSLHLTRRLLIETVGPDRHFIFNPLSGAVDLASDSDVALLDEVRSGNGQSLTSDQEQAFRERRYLFDSPAAEESFLEGAVASAWQRMQMAQPEAYTVCPTLACNLACAYCFEGDSLTDKPQGVMTEKQVTQLFAAIASLRTGLANAGHSSPLPPWIALFGGEPLLPSTRRCVAVILEQAAAGGFLVGATTNGVNLTRFEDLLREYADILAGFQVTLDGPRTMHDSRRHRLGGQGTFDEIVRGIDLLLSLDVEVDLRVNLDATNLPALPELVDFVMEKGWHEHPGFDLALAPVTHHQEKSACASRADRALSEMELGQGVLALMEAHPQMREVCHMGFLRHLEYLVSVLEPEKLGRGRRGGVRRAGPRYWYCEASTDKQFVFTPDGLIYSCTEAVGKPEHAIGRFDPALDIWRQEQTQWVGRTILSHPKCRACSISTLCGGGCHLAAREKNHNSVASLVQVWVKGQSALPKAAPLPATVQPQPFCNAAEETVRSYLRYSGMRAIVTERTGVTTRTSRDGERRHCCKKR